MASYKVIPKPSVEKDLRSQPVSVLKRVSGHVEALENDPFPRGSLNLPVRSSCIVYASATTGSYMLSTRVPGR
jgi:hypothetical protein